MFENVDKNPAYGMLLFSRISGGDPNLFGSSVQHNEKIRLALTEGQVTRELSNDWYFGNRTLFEVEMSYTQFAELISSMNVGSGVPVTIRYIAGKGDIPGIENVTDKRTQFINEFKEARTQSAETVNALISQLTAILGNKRAIKASERHDILQKLTLLENAVNSYNDFVLSQFNEAMEGIATEAKGEVEAFVQAKMNSLALAAMKETVSADNPLILPNIDSSTEGEELP